MKEGVEKEVMNAVEWIRIEAKEPWKTDAAGVGVNWKAASEAQSSEADINPSANPGLASTGRVRWRREWQVPAARSFRRLVGTRLKDGTVRRLKMSRRRDAMDWLEDDEMMRRWDEVSKEEEQILVRRKEGSEIQVERAQSATELVARAQVQGKEAGAVQRKVLPIPAEQGERQIRR